LQVLVIFMEVQFWHWVNLQKCLKYDSLRLEHDDADKQQLLEKLQKAQVEYYRHQLHIRELVGKVRPKSEIDSQGDG